MAGTEGKFSNVKRKFEENCVSGSKKYWKFGNTIGSGYTTI